MKNHKTQQQRPIKIGRRVGRKVRTPKDLHWKVFRSLLLDLGFRDPSVRVEQAQTDWHRPSVRFKNTELFNAIRQRDADALMEIVPTLEPRSMLGKLEAKKENAFTFFAHYQAGSFLKKFPFSGADTYTPAVAKFEQYERRCQNFNRENYRALIRVSGKHPRFYGIIDEVRKEIRELLGNHPNVDSICGHAKHGPGVSLGTAFKNGQTTSFYKWFGLPYTVTEQALPMAKHAISSDPQWMGALMNWYRSRLGGKKFYAACNQTIPIDMQDFWSRVFKVVEFSKITTVPKTALTDRTIAIEALMNVYLQLGVDYVIRRRLLHWKVDLNDQGINKKLALEASLTGSFSTLDLAGASDTVALMLCRIYLPEAWYDLLLDLRSPQGATRDREYHFEKISSMGNGFTFALESLIFAALTRVAIRRTRSEFRYAVYGDDIIVPTKAAQYLIELLELSGFKINRDKSFTSGPFRESCGSDFYFGQPVRPVYLKKTLTSVQDLFYIHNAIFELQEKLPWHWNVDFERTLNLIRKYIPENVRQQFFGPRTEALDTHLFSYRKLTKDANGNRQFYAIIPKAAIFDERYFYFRKMMVRPRGRSRDRFSLRDVIRVVRSRDLVSLHSRRILNLMKDGRYASGDGFAVTRRDRVSWHCRAIAAYG